jgi:hypothetical protein
MKVIFLVFIAIAASLLFSAPEVAAAPSPIEVDAKPGVSSTQVKYTTLAINDIVRFFWDNYKIALHRKLRLILVPDDKVYETVLINDFKETPANAQKKAKSVGGTAKEIRGQYILVLKAKESVSMAAMIKVASHEMIHWYQYEAGGSKKSAEIKWLLEGVAEVMALQITEAHQSGEFDKYRENSLKALKKAAQIPSLKDLHSRKDWNAAMEKYGGAVVYRKAGLAVMELAQRQGVKTLFSYFINLKPQTPAKAFEQAFHLNLQKFENEMDQKYRK